MLAGWEKKGHVHGKRGDGWVREAGGARSAPLSLVTPGAPTQ